MVRIAGTGCKTSFGGTGDAFGDPGRFSRRVSIRTVTSPESEAWDHRWRNKARQNCPQHTHEVFTDLISLSTPTAGVESRKVEADTGAIRTIKKVGFLGPILEPRPLESSSGYPKDTPIPPLVWDRLAWASVPSDPMNILAHSDHKALSVPIVSLRHTCVDRPC